MTPKTKTLEYAGPAYYEKRTHNGWENVEIVLPHGTYEIEDEQLADPSVGIFHSCVVLWVDGYDGPVVVTADQFDDWADQAI